MINVASKLRSLLIIKYEINSHEPLKKLYRPSHKNVYATNNNTKAFIQTQRQLEADNITISLKTDSVKYSIKFVMKPR